MTTIANSWKQCRQCSGTGKQPDPNRRWWQMFKKITCPHCDGTGQAGVGPKPKPPPMPPPRKMCCTCLGTCRGAEGLGERWYCALIGPRKP